MTRTLLAIGTCFLLLVISASAGDSLITGGPYSSGDEIRMYGLTNYNTDNRVLVEVFPASFGPAAKYEPSMNGGYSAVVPVQPTGEGSFSWSVNMSTAGWKPDQYMVRIEVIGKDFRETALFDLTEQTVTSSNLTTPAPVLIPANKTADANIPGNTTRVQVKPEITVSSGNSSPTPAAVETSVPDPSRKSPLSLLTVPALCIALGLVILLKKE